MEIDAISELLNELSNIHFPSGPIYQEVERRRAHLGTDELTCIYHLSESHVPGLRYKAIYRYEKNMKNESDNKCIGINKRNIDFSCKDEDLKENIMEMLQKVEEMPKEWVIIQLTPDYNPEGNFETLEGTRYTNALYMTVFHCGANQPKPFYIKIDAPVDKISGKVIQIRQEMESIIVDNKKSFTNIKTSDKKADQFNSHIDKHLYSKARYVVNNRLKNLVKDIQGIWLGEWRCLFAGKLTDEDEDEISEKLELLLLNCQMKDVPKKIKCILRCLIRSSNHLKMAEMKRIVQYCFPDNGEFHVSLSKAVYELGQNDNFSQRKRHPVILVVDEKLDTLPWEMLDVLQDHPASRMPSLHFTYALFKEHEQSIVNGVKVGIDYQKGKYIINPGLDLKRMETRLHNFFKYWTPHWDGLVGIRPSREEFGNLLLNCDIFSYNGHGNGTQFFSSDRIQRLRINSVVLLFGCGSVKYTNLGPQVEMFGSHQMYLIACSPCVVGMLWEVTDFDTDTLATEFWSTWLPQGPNLHWKYINKKKWEVTGEVEPNPNVKDSNSHEKHEPELLRALSKARKSAHQYLTQASCVARGIPVKINC
ncbi:hypothetical protein Trydic_g4122 [Trypoxylus dichotomus]